MKTHNQLPATAKVFAIALLLQATQQLIMAQVSLFPLSGSIYGQPVISSCYNNGQRYVTTASAIYACQGVAGGYYSKVYAAPVGYQITNASVAHYYRGDYHAVILESTSSSNLQLGASNFLSLNRINTLAPDSDNAALLPINAGSFAPYTKTANSGQVLYALSHLVGCGIQGNLYVSFDEGQTWDEDTAGTGYTTVYDFAVDNNGTVFKLSGSVYMQAGADTSSATLLNLPADFYTSIFIDRINRIIVTGFEGTYYSLDDGQTFTTNPLLNGTFSFFADDNKGNLYAMGTDSIGQPMLLRMDTVGNWVRVNSNYASLLNGSAALGINSFSGDKVLLLGTKFGLFASSDNGVTFTPDNKGIWAEDIFSIINQPNGRQLCSTDIGAFYKDAADTVWHLGYSNAGGMMLYNDAVGNIFAEQSGTANNFSNAPIVTSSDNGITYTPYNPNINGLHGNSFYVDEKGGQHFYSTYQLNMYPLYIWSKNANDSAWYIDSAGLGEVQFGGQGVNAVYGDGQGYLYADLKEGNNNMYRRPVNGTQWVIDTTGLPLGQTVMCMASNPQYGIIAATRGWVNTGNVSTLYHRTANGWVVIPTRTDSTSISAVSVDANGVIFVEEVPSPSATISATYYTSDGGITWSAANLTGMNFQGSTIFQQGTPVQGGLVSIGNTTYALTEGNRAFVFTSQDTTTSIDTNSTTGIKVTAAKLNDIQVFPNPSIDGLWNLKTTSEIVDGQMQVMDMNGRIVYSALLNSSKFTISLPGLARGVYLLSITYGGKTTGNFLVKQ